MSLLDCTLPSLAENLALDEALLLDAEAGSSGEVLRFWEWPTYAVVLGAGGKLGIDVNETACDRDRIPIERRASGGGTVLLGRGCLLFSLVLNFARDPALRDINRSYAWILEKMKSALMPICLADHVGICDLAVGGRKFSGNAQQRKRDHVLHHGTILYDFDLAMLGRYLLMPERRPDYRGVRNHHEFVMNLQAKPAELRTLFTAEWGAVPQPWTMPSARVAELVAEKYALDEWTRRR
ncbi:MAG: lipoate--protein ligase family protein [Planctomycetes bacterium]|nr:lipoate--protein ligase family protein [Planctomycetota bacterium]